MKRYEFYIDREFIDSFFSPIRDKSNNIRVLMEALKYMILNPTVDSSRVSGKIVVQIDKMSRIFFFSNCKFYSIYFPFYVANDGRKYNFSYKDFFEVDARIISQVISFIKCDSFDAPCSLDFIQPISEFEDYDDGFWYFIKDLLLMEAGYIRYDYDEENYKKFKSEGQEHKHPLHHYDIFYSNSVTFKIGLSSVLKETDFIDFLDLGKNCLYLKSPT